MARTGPTATVATGVMAAMATEPSRLLTKLAALLHAEQGTLRFSEDALAKVGAVIEVSARLKDEAHGAAALTEVIRLAIALDEGGHTDAAKAIRASLLASPAAVKRLAAVRERDKVTHERFERFTESERARTAPHLEAEVQAGLSLKALLPAGVGRRLERSVEAPSPAPEGARHRSDGPRAKGRPPEPEVGLPGEGEGPELAPSARGAGRRSFDVG